VEDDRCRADRPLAGGAALEGDRHRADGRRAERDLEAGLGASLAGDEARRRSQDRKSTRLNSSHEWISYAVFCLKKKNLEARPLLGQDQTPFGVLLRHDERDDLVAHLAIVMRDDRTANRQLASLDYSLMIVPVID